MFAIAINNIYFCYPFRFSFFFLISEFCREFEVDRSVLLSTVFMGITSGNIVSNLFTASVIVLTVKLSVSAGDYQL